MFCDVNIQRIDIFNPDLLRIEDSSLFLKWLSIQIHKDLFSTFMDFMDFYIQPQKIIYHAINLTIKLV